MDAEPERARSSTSTCAHRSCPRLSAAADRVAITGDGGWLLVVDKDRLNVVPSGKAVPKEEDGENVQRVDLDQLRVEVDPPVEWRQMLDETWRLMRDHFWRDGHGRCRLAGSTRQVRAAARSAWLARRPDRRHLGDARRARQLARVRHPATARPTRARRQGLLGADLEYTGDAWRISRIVPGDASDRNARSPLLAPGVGARPVT